MSAFLLVSLMVQPAFSDEGMWRPEQLESVAEDMGKSGLKLEAGQLADLGGSVMGSIVDLAHCSGAFVSADGLIVTSYHCIGSSLQYASQDGEDLFENGFHAKTQSEERWGGASERIRLTIGANNVTAQVLAGTKRLSGAAYFDRIEENTSRLVERCESIGNVRCRVAVYGQGSEYQLLTQREFRDVRLVYSPPRSVGYFGGSKDNWQWPRHSGDFAFLRVYADDAGRSARYSPEHKPYKPEHFLPVSRRSVKAGDFVMVAGYPRRTYRWNSAAELDYTQNEQYPRQVASIRGMMSILENRSTDDPRLASKVAPRMLTLGNNLQYIEGTLHGFGRTGLDRRKWLFEKDLLAWINADRDRKERYGNTLGRLNVLQAEIAGLEARNRVMADLAGQSTMLKTALLIYKLASESAKPDRRRKSGFQNRNRPRIEGQLDGMTVGYDWQVDREVLGWNLERALKLPSGARPAELDEWFQRGGTAPTMRALLDEKLARLYDHEDLADAEHRRSLMDSTPWYLTHHGNPWFELAASLHPYFERVDAEQKSRLAEIRALKPKYMRAVGEFVAATRSGSNTFYADANGTLRLTYGVVRGYTPRDGVQAAAHTTLRGILEKDGDHPFDSPPGLIRAIERRQWGSYGDEELDSIPVNFVSTLDTARGSSGSATMDAEGNWVGLIFDGNYESMVSDWVYDDRLTRSIHTDAAYVLWYLDAVAGADALLRELGKEPELTPVEVSTK